jgi:hypothetical protein
MAHADWIIDLAPAAGHWEIRWPRMGRSGGRQCDLTAAYGEMPLAAVRTRGRAAQARATRWARFSPYEIAGPDLRTPSRDFVVDMYGLGGKDVRCGRPATTSPVKGTDGVPSVKGEDREVHDPDDGCLKLVGADGPVRQRAGEQRDSLGDGLGVPPGAVLVGHRDWSAAGAFTPFQACSRGSHAGTAAR